MPTNPRARAPARGCPRGIKRNPNRGFRRGEGGWVDERWALMVARCGTSEARIPHPRATIKAHPTTPPSPLRKPIAFLTLMPIRADESAVGAINRPLRLLGLL